MVLSKAGRQCSQYDRSYGVLGSPPLFAKEGLGRAARRLTRIPPINPNAPLLSKDDYFTIPDIKRLRRFSDDELQVRTYLLP